MTIDTNINQIENMINKITPEIYEKLVTAVEIGKWADGVPLTDAQKRDTLQLVMLWQAKNNNEAEHMSINTRGEIVIETKQEMLKKFVGDRIEINVKE